MTLDVTKPLPTRRRLSAGLLFSLAATLAIVVAAWPGAQTVDRPVSFELTDTTLLVTSSGRRPMAASTAAASSPAQLSDVRARLRAFAAGGDARYLRYAEVELDALLAASDPDAETLLLAARIQQARHEFRAAALTLEEALERSPQSAEAWLLYADVLRRTGDVPGARTACLKLAFAGHAMLAQYCGLQVSLTVGEHEAGYRSAMRLLPQVENLPPSAQPWALEITAETAAASDRTGEAIALYRRALSLGDPPLATRLAFADLLLAESRHAAVLDLLAGDSGNLAALVRIAAARTALDADIDRLADARLATAFSALEPEATDALLFRDRALYELRVRNDPDAALRFALANWERQKSFEDLGLLTMAAVAAADHDVLREIDRWQARARVQGRS